MHIKFGGQPICGAGISPLTKYVKRNPNTREAAVEAHVCAGCIETIWPVQL